MKRAAVPLFAIALLLSACQPNEQQAQAAASHAAPVRVATAPPAFTKADWDGAIKATYEEKNAKTDNEGVTEFTACFKHTADGKKCEVFAFGTRDAFRKMTRFQPASSKLYEIAGVDYLHSYVSLADCGLPVIVLRPYFFSKAGWMFLNQVAVMADGNVVLEHKFTSNDVRREPYAAGVQESAAWVPQGSELDAIQTIADSKSVIIRLTGDRGYVTVKQEQVKDIKEDLKALLTYYAALQSAASSHKPAVCKA